MSKNDSNILLKTYFVEVAEIEHRALLWAKIFQSSPNIDIIQIEKETQFIGINTQLTLHGRFEERKCIFISSFPLQKLAHCNFVEIGDGFRMSNLAASVSNMLVICPLACKVADAGFY